MKHKTKYHKLVPTSSFIGQYLDYMQDQETAVDYDFWAAVWVLASACGRDILIDRPRAPIYLNWFVIFVGESGVTRKSTSVSSAVKLLREVLPVHHKLIETKTTPEKLELILHQATVDHNRATVSIAISELVTFLGKERYTTAMPTLLTDLYDSPSQRRGGGTVSHDERIMKDVFVSFLSASTPVWLVKAVNPDVIEGGFTSRCVFVHAEQRKNKIAWPSDKVKSIEPMLELIRTAQREIQQIKKLPVAPSGMDAYTAWYKKRAESQFDPFVSSFESREDAHVLRLAATLAINDGSYAISARHITVAVRCISIAKHNGAALFASSVDPSRAIIGVDRIITILVECGQIGIRHSELRNRTRSYFELANVFNNAMNIMQDLEMVQKFIIKKARGRTGTIWRATKFIRDHDKYRGLIDYLHDS